MPEPFRTLSGVNFAEDELAAARRRPIMDESRQVRSQLLDVLAQQGGGEVVFQDAAGITNIVAEGTGAGLPRFNSQIMDRIELEQQTRNLRDQLTPLVRTGEIDEKLMQQLMSGATADLVGSQLDRSQARRDLQAINRAYSGGQIDQNQYNEAMNQVEQRYGIGTLAAVPEYAKAAEIQEAVRAIKQQQVQAWEQQMGAPGYGQWDEESGQPTFNWAKLNFEQFQAKQRKLMADAQKLENEPAVAAQKIALETKQKAFEAQMEALKAATIDRAPDIGEKGGGLFEFDTVEKGAEMRAKAFDSYLRGAEQLQREFFPEAATVPKGPAAPEQAAQAANKKYYATPEQVRNAKLTGDLKPGTQYVDGDGNIRTAS